MVHGHFIFQEATTVAELDSTEVADVLASMEGNYNRGWGRISNVLCFHYGQCRPPLTGGQAPEPAMLLSPPVQQQQQQAALLSPAFRMYPNPTRDRVTVEVQLLVEDAGGFLRLRDLAGREVAAAPLTGASDCVEMDLRGRAPGLYVVEVSVNGRVEHTSKLVVQ
jgi:hypothetical protein